MAPLWQVGDPVVYTFGFGAHAGERAIHVWSPDGATYRGFFDISAIAHDDEGAGHLQSRYPYLYFSTFTTGHSYAYRTDGVTIEQIAVVTGAGIGGGEYIGVSVDGAGNVYSFDPGWDGAAVHYKLVKLAPDLTHLVDYPYDSGDPLIGSGDSNAATLFINKAGTRAYFSENLSTNFFFDSGGFVNRMDLSTGSLLSAVDCEPAILGFAGVGWRSRAFTVDGSEHIVWTVDQPNTGGVAIITCDATGAFVGGYWVGAPENGDLYNDEIAVALNAAATLGYVLAPNAYILRLDQVGETKLGTLDMFAEFSIVSYAPTGMCVVLPAINPALARYRASDGALLWRRNTFS